MDRILELTTRFPELKICSEDVLNAVNAIIDCYKAGGKVLICGNGGSSSDSSHIVGEFMKGFLKLRPLSAKKRAELKSNCADITDELLDNLQGSLPAINLTENSGIISAFANDVDPVNVYAQQVLGYGKKGDVLIGITTSGNSGNVLNACNLAKGLGLTVIGLTGRDGGKLKNASDICIIAPEHETFKIQELHLPIYHCICAMVEEAFYTE